MNAKKYDPPLYFEYGLTEERLNLALLWHKTRQKKDESTIFDETKIFGEEKR